ncbi:MAG TPA: amino acid adenylation domain-containing protein, partial [Thermoanaerobaculia bacterium]
GSHGALTENLAYVIYTSGSTGKPKGVAVTHANVVRLLRATEPWFGFGPDDVWTLFHSYAFDFSVWEIWGALLYGGRLVVVPYTVSRTPEAFHDLLEAERVTVLNQTPTAFAELMRADADPARAGALAALRLVIFGGEALVPSSLAGWFARHGDAQPQLINMYGITETTVFVTWRPLSAAEEQDGPGSVIGIPIPDLAVHVLDITGQPVPIGVPGELMIGGAGLARGYVGRPDLTAERFVPDPFSGRPGACLYRSGDLGRFLPAGEIEYFGRIDHQVKIRGFRIEPGEIEAALLALPGVRQAVVLPEAGRLLAFVVLVIPAAQEAEAQPNVSTLRPLLAATLPEHMVPSAFVALDALPRTANGKVDRRALLAAWAALGSAAADEEGFIAPRDPVEELLAGIFAEVLGIDTVGAEAHFFALGGHSLLATQVVSRVRRDLGVELPLRLLFEEPTVGGLAARVREALAASSFDLEPWTPIPRRDTGVAAPLSFAQERLWFLDQMTPGSPIYNIPGALALAGRLDVTALASAFAAVVRRHEGPRTVFRAPAGEPFQVVLPAVPPPLPMVDLTALPAAARAAEAARQQGAEAMRGFDLASGPLFRACLLRLAHSSDETGSHVLLLTFHHIVFDGWSTSVLARELSALYDAALAGQSAQLPELPIQYADFASWQRTRFTGATLERFAGYWRQRLTGVPPLRLPLDRPRPPLQSYSGSGEPLALTALSEAVRRLARQRTATPFMVGLAAYAALLHRASGQSDFAVGTWVANRTRPEFEGLIGFFVNNLALRFEVSGSASFGELLEQVREVALGAYAHQELPFEKLIEDLKLPRDLSLPPVFQVVCVQPPPAGRLELFGLRLGIETAAGDRAHVDLSLDLAGGLAGPGAPAGGSASTLIYNHELFDRATIARLSRAFERLLAAALAGTTTPVSELPLLSPAEAWQLAGEWSRGLPNPALRRASGIGFVHQLIERQVALRPDAEAVVWPGSPEERVTFGDLNARANRLARLLRCRGVGPETRVALWLPRSIDAVVSILAVLKAGGCYVPLDTAYSGERLAFMAADSQARVVLTRGETGAVAGATGAAVVRLDDPAVAAALAAESAADLAPEEAGLAPADPDNLAYVIYTSGSTGRPKGTMIEHRSLLTAYYAYERAYHLRDVTCHLQMASLSFDVFTGDFIRALGSGARLVLCPREVLLDPERLDGLMRAEHVDGAELVPAVVRTLVEHLEHRGGALDFMRLLVVS